MDGCDPYWLSIIGGGKWVEITVYVDAAHQHLLLTAERKLWRCLQIGESPRMFVYRRTRADAKEAMGHGVCGKRSKSGTISFEEVADAPLH